MCASKQQKRGSCCARRHRQFGQGRWSSLLFGLDEVVLMLWLLLPAVVVAQQAGTVVSIQAVCPVGASSASSSHVLMPIINGSSTIDTVYYQLVLDCEDAARHQFVITPPLLMYDPAAIPQPSPPGLSLTVLVYRPIGQLVFATNASGNAVNQTSDMATAATHIRFLNVTFFANATVNIDSQQQPSASDRWLQLVSPDGGGERRDTNFSMVVLLAVPSLMSLTVTTLSNQITLVGPGAVFLDFLQRLPAVTVGLTFGSDTETTASQPTTLVCKNGCRFVLVRPLQTSQQPMLGFRVLIRQALLVASDVATGAYRSSSGTDATTSGTVSASNGTSAFVDVYQFPSLSGLDIRVMGGIAPLCQTSAVVGGNNSSTRPLVVRIGATNFSEEEGGLSPAPVDFTLAHLILASSLQRLAINLTCVASLDIASGGALLRASTVALSTFSIQHTKVNVTASSGVVLADDGITSLQTPAPQSSRLVVFSAAVVWIDDASTGNQFHFVSVDTSVGGGGGAIQEGPTAAVLFVGDSTRSDQVALATSRVALVSGGSAYFIFTREVGAIRVQLTATDVWVRNDAAAFMYGVNLFNSMLEFSCAAAACAIKIVHGMFIDVDLMSSVTLVTSGVAVLLDSGERDSTGSRDATCVFLRCRGTTNFDASLSFQGEAIVSPTVNVTVAGGGVLFQGPVTDMTMSFLGLSVHYSSNLWYERCLVQTSLLSNSIMVFDGAARNGSGSGTAANEGTLFELTGNPCLFGSASTVSAFDFVVRNTRVAWAEVPWSSVTTPSVSMFFTGFFGELTNVRIEMERCIGHVQNLRLAWSDFGVLVLRNVQWRLSGGSVLAFGGALTLMSAKAIDASAFTVDGNGTHVTCKGSVQGWSASQSMTDVNALVLQDGATLVLSERCVWTADGVQGGNADTFAQDSANVTLLDAGGSGSQLVLRNYSRLGSLNAVPHQGTTLAMHDACLVTLNDASRLLQVQASSRLPVADVRVDIVGGSSLVAATSVVAVIFFSGDVAGAHLSALDNASIRLSNVALLMARHISNVVVNVARGVQLVLNTSLVDRPEGQYVAPPCGLIVAQNGNVSNLTVHIVDDVRVNGFGSKVWLVSAFATRVAVDVVPSVLNSSIVLRGVVWVGAQAASNRLLSVADGRTQSVSVGCEHVLLQIQRGGVDGGGGWVHLGDASGAAPPPLLLPISVPASVVIRLRNCTLVAMPGHNANGGIPPLPAPATAVGIVNLSAAGVRQQAAGGAGVVYVAMEACWVAGFDVVLVGVTPTVHHRSSKAMVNITSCGSNRWSAEAPSASSPASGLPPSADPDFSWRLLNPKYDVAGPGPTLDHFVTVVKARRSSTSWPQCGVTASASYSVTPTWSEPITRTASRQDPVPLAPLPLPFAAVRTATDMVATTTVAGSMVVSSTIPRPAAASSLIQLSASAIACAGASSGGDGAVDGDSPDGAAAPDDDDGDFSSGIADNPLQIRVPFDWGTFAAATTSPRSNNNEGGGGGSSAAVNIDAHHYRRGVEFACGTVVGNALVVWPAYVLLLVGAQWVRRCRRRRQMPHEEDRAEGGSTIKSSWDALLALAAAANLPGAFVVPFSLLLQPTAIASVGLVGRCSRIPDGACALGLVGAACCLGPCMWFAALLLRPPTCAPAGTLRARRGRQHTAPALFYAKFVGGDGTGTNNSNSDTSDSDDNRPLASRLSTSKWGNRWRAFAEPQWIWKEVKLQLIKYDDDEQAAAAAQQAARRRCYFQGIVALVEPYRRGCQCFVLVELCTILATAIPIGVAWALDNTGGGACDASLWVVLVFACLAMLASTLRPFSAPIENVWAVAMHAMTVAVVAALLSQDGAAVANGVALAQSIGSVLPVLRLLPATVLRARHEMRVMAKKKPAAARTTTSNGASDRTMESMAVTVGGSDATIAVGEQGRASALRRTDRRSGPTVAMQYHHNTTTTREGTAAAVRRRTGQVPAPPIHQRIHVARLLLRALAESRRTTPPTPRELRENVALLVQLAVASSVVSMDAMLSSP